MNVTDEQLDNMVREVDEAICKLKVSLASQYDARIVFACFLEAAGSMAAAMMHCNIYTKQEMASRLAEFSIQTLDRKSEAKLLYMGKESKREH